jgi:hypothetical protein
MLQSAVLTESHIMEIGRYRKSFTPFFVFFVVVVVVMLFRDLLTSYLARKKI